MPPKGSSHGRSTAQAARSAALTGKQSRQAAGNSEPEPTMASLQESLELSKARIQELEERVAELETAVRFHEQHSAELSQALSNKQDQSAMLAEDLSAEVEHSTNLYKSLRVERRARQRGQAQKGRMEEQIRLLKSADFRMSSDLHKIKSNASKAIDALLKVEKENSTLRSELSNTLEQCTAEAIVAQKRLDQASQKMKEQKRLAANLKKRCDRAAVVQANALKRANEHAKKANCVHNLLKKGVYTEKTQNLIRLLVQAGCS